jgi:hypothetical protein
MGLEAKYLFHEEITMNTTSEDFNYTIILGAIGAAFLLAIIASLTQLF